MGKMVTYKKKEIEEEIDLIIETIVDPDTVAIDASKAVVKNLLDTVWKIMHESVNKTTTWYF